MGIYHFMILFMLPNGSFTLLKAELNFDRSSASYKNLDLRVS
jgi:hypothetical protein